MKKVNWTENEENDECKEMPSRIVKGMTCWTLGTEVYRGGIDNTVTMSEVLATSGGEDQSGGGRNKQRRRECKGLTRSAGKAKGKGKGQ